MKAQIIESKNSPYLYKEIQLKFKMLQDNTQIGYNEFENARTRTIFEDGICVLTENRVEKNDLIKIEMPLEKRTIKTFCDVEWCNWDDEAGAYEAKLSFITLKEEDILTLAEFIKKNS